MLDARDIEEPVDKQRGMGDLESRGRLGVDSGEGESHRRVGGLS